MTFIMRSDTHDRTFSIKEYSIKVLDRMRSPEFQYLELLEEILERGDQRLDRTGVGTKSIFGAMMRYDLSDGTIPIVTTKKVSWKTAIKEALWFLTGNTNIQPLVRENVGIWTDWPLATYRRESGESITQKEFERRIVEDDAFAARWGDLGPVYGKQWRRWLGPDGREHDQIATLVDTLRSNPTSRRMLFTAWNVGELDQMALPPCHIVYQYHVTSDGRLNSLLFQRSVDTLLGLAFNQITAAALQIMLAQQTGLRPGQLVWMGGDVHLYLNHLEQARTQVQREPRPFPTLRLARHPASIDDYRIEDFIVEGYDPHPAIHADVAV
jgi:thymidylate synthase